jgi:hypothetical protein
MQRKALIFAFANGDLTNISAAEEFNPSSDFQKRVQPRAFMRVGAYSVVLGMRDLAIAAPDEYRTPLPPLNRNSPYYGASKHDRLVQLRRVEAALAAFGHPFEGLVRDEIAAERKSYVYFGVILSEIKKIS